MNNFPMKKIAAGVIVALGLAGAQSAYAAATGKEKVAIKIAPTKLSVGSEKNAKKMLKGVPWTPCISATTSYRKGTVTPITIDGTKVTADDKLSFSISASDVSADNPLYFYLVDPSGNSSIGDDPLKVLLYKTVDTAAVGTAIDDLTTIVPATDFLSTGTTGKYKSTIDAQFDATGVHAAQGTWTAVAFIAPKTLTEAELREPKNWLASSIQPFVLGTPYFNGKDCAGADVVTGPKLVYSPATFTEAEANDGSTTTVSTITLTGDTFTGADNDDWSSLVTNVPDGLTAVLIRTSATTATLSLTGNATAHADANDVSNLTVTFDNAKFTGGSAAAINGATKSDLIIDFMDPVVDTTAPVYESVGVDVTAKTVTLTFDEAVANNTADAAALKAAVTFSTDGSTYGALDTLDTVSAVGTSLTITFDTLPALENLSIKVAANTLKDEVTPTANVLATETLVPIPPVLVSAAGLSTGDWDVNTRETVVTLTFSEAITNALADVTALEDAISYSLDGGTTWSTPGSGIVLAGDGSSIVNNVMTVGLINAGESNTTLVKVAAGALKDSADHLTSEDSVTAAFDTAGPNVVDAATAGASTVADQVVITFDETTIVDNTANTAALTLNGAVKLSATGAPGTGTAIDASDTVAIANNNTLQIDFAGATQAGNTVYIHITPEALKDSVGNTSPWEIIVGPVTVTAP